MIARTVNRLLKPLGVRLLRESASVSAKSRRVNASRSVFDELDHTISAGPFVGTKLAQQFAWGDASVGAVVLGCYEEQLHPAIEAMVAADPDVVVNIGSAEGTYAIGMARRLPSATVIALDVEPMAEVAVRENARLNGVSDRVEVHLGWSPADVERCIRLAQRPAILIDCEGHEQEFLDPVAVPSLARSSVLVEVHEHLVPGIGQVLRDRFSGTHEIETIVESGRNPHQYEVLQKMHSIDKWLVVSEGRDVTMSWFWCRPRLG